MKVKINLVYLSFLFLVLLFCTCKKDHSGPPEPKGTTLDRSEYTDNIGGSVSILVYNYNSYGDLVSISSGSGTGLGSDTLIYESAGKLLEYRAGSVWKTTMEYDGNGRIIKKTGILSQNTTPFVTTLYTYDNIGRITADSSIDDTGKVYEYHSFSYDNNGNMISYQISRRFNGDSAYTSDGPVIVTFDHHPNPNAKFGKWVYYGDGDFTYLFKENSLSEKVGQLELKIPPDVIYEYYSNGLLWKTTSERFHSTTKYYYKAP